jgi:hypothetical protein
MVSHAASLSFAAVTSLVLLLLLLHLLHLLVLSADGSLLMGLVC